MTHNEVYRLRLLLESATQRPWEIEGPFGMGYRIYPADSSTMAHASAENVRDADLIVAAVNRITPLLDIVESFAQEEPLTFHVPSGASFCLYCAGKEDTNWRVQHADNCPWLAARRLCVMEGDE